MKTIISILNIFVMTSILFSQQSSIYLDNSISTPGKADIIKINKEGRFMAYGMDDGKIILYDISAKREIRKLNGHSDKITFLLFDGENKYLISSGSDKQIIIWDLYSGNQIKFINNFTEQVNYLDISPDNKTLLACGKSDDIMLWDFPVCKLKGVLKGHEDNVVFASFNLNGDQIISVGEDSKMIVWNPNQMKLIRQTEIAPLTMINSGISVISARCSADKYFIGIGIEERALEKNKQNMIFNYNISFYEWNSGREIETIKGNNKKIKHFCVSPDKNYIVTDNSTLRENQFSIWNIQKGIVEQNYELNGEILSTDFCDNGKYMAVSYKNQSNSIINVYQVSGVNAYERNNQSQTLVSKMNSNFGNAIKLTTPSDPLIQLGEKKRLAVMYFDAQGITQEIAKTATSLLESKIGNSRYVTLIERNQIDKILAELKVQISGFNASDVVDIGKQLNANYILIGTLNKLGNIIIITSKLVNVETAQIEGTREVQCSDATIENIADMVSLLAPSIVKF